MCTQLVAGSFAFIGDHAPLRHADAVLQDRATGDRQPASMARWQVARPARASMRDARASQGTWEPGRLCQGKRRKRSSPNARYTAGAAPPIGGGPRTNFGRQGATGARFLSFSASTVPGLLGRPAHAIVPRRRNRAASKQRNSRRRASPGAPVSFGSRRHARYRWRPLKQQRSYRQSGSGNKRYPTLSLTK